MKERIEQRLIDLRTEVEHGYQRLTALDKEREETRDTILRIKGAIQVLEELIEDTKTSGDKTTPVTTDSLKSTNN